MFETLLRNILRAQAAFDFELARTNDPYRLATLLNTHMEELENFRMDAENMVDELEDCDYGFDG
jgi:hypothetical protein